MVALRTGEGGRQRQQKLVVRPQHRRGLDHFRQVEPDFLAPAARQKADPGFRRIDTGLAGEFVPADLRRFQLGQRMPDKLSFDAPVAVKLLLEGKDSQHAIHVALDAADAILLPRPQLRAHEVDHRHAQGLQPPGQREIHVRKIDQNSSVGLFLRDRGAQPAIFAINARHVADDLGDSHDRHVFGAHNGSKAESLHAATAQAEELRVRQEPAQGGDNQGPIVLAAGLTG